MVDAMTPLEAVWTAEPVLSRQGLTLDRIVASAIEIADAGGLGAVAMARVAERTGFTPMALYRHVASKDELLLHMRERAIGPPPADLAPTGDWQADLRRWAWATLALLRAHPWYVSSLTATGSMATPNYLRFVELALQALAPTSLTEVQKVETILLINAHVLGDLTFHAIEDGAADDEAAVLSRFLDPEQFPAFVRAASAGAFASAGDAAAERDELFSFGLERILDGVAAYLA